MRRQSGPVDLGFFGKLDTDPQHLFAALSAKRNFTKLGAETVDGVAATQLAIAGSTFEVSAGSLSEDCGLPQHTSADAMLHGHASEQQAVGRALRRDGLLHRRRLSFAPSKK